MMTTPTSEPIWIQRAREYLGVREDTAKYRHNPIILDMLESMGKFNGEARAWWSNDEVPWCGLFVGYVLGISGRYVIKEWYRAGDWRSTTMTKLDGPAVGCLAVFDRAGGGHVGFVVGRDQHDNIMVLGGNQSNRVSIAPFKPDGERRPTFYWPSKVRAGRALVSTPYPGRYHLPLMRSDGTLSVNEA